MRCPQPSPIPSSEWRKIPFFTETNPVLQCAAFAGSPGPCFFCPLHHFALIFRRREARCFSAGKDGYFVSEGFSQQLPVATATHKRLTRLQQGRSGFFVVSFPYPAPKIAHRAVQGLFAPYLLYFSPTGKSWADLASVLLCPAQIRPQLLHTAPTVPGPVWGCAGVVPLLSSQNRTQALTGPSLGSSLFSGAL